jgi:hypothetical protein
MVFKPAVNYRNKTAGFNARQALDKVRQQIKRLLGGDKKKTKPGAVDDDALKRLREREKKLKQQLKEAG